MTAETLHEVERLKRNRNALRGKKGRRGNFHRSRDSFWVRSARREPEACVLRLGDLEVSTITLHKGIMKRPRDLNQLAAVSLPP